MVFGFRKQGGGPAQPQPQSSSMEPPPPPAPRPPSARTLTRENDRTVTRAKRDTERERIRLEAEERKIMNEVKALGRQGRMTEARMLAKNLVQVRNAKAKTFQAGVQMSAIGHQARMAQTDATVMGVVGSATDIMQKANGLSNPEQHMKMVQQFDMQSEQYKLNQEMTDEVLDSVLGGDEVDAETDDVLGSVLDEIGLEVSAQAGQTPAIRPQAVAPLPQAQSAQPIDDSELMNRLARLGGPS